jgi:hypothetical protein
MNDLWPSAGYAHLQTDANGWLQATPAYVRHLLARPELALVPESCRAERALHRALHDDPWRAVSSAELQAVRDADARENFAHFITVRDGQLAAGSLQAWLLQLFRSGRITVPPLFIDLAIQAVVQHLLQGQADTASDALAWRAGELFFRPQRVTVEQGRVLAADSTSLDHEQATQGLGELGRLLAQAQAPLKTLQLRVLDAEADAQTAPRYFEQAAQADFRSTLLLDLTHTVHNDLGQGIAFTMTAARSGLKPLALLMARWVQHFLGVAVLVQPLQKVEDSQWRWHLGLDTEASVLLDDLYQDHEVEPARLARLISLFSLVFDKPAEMRADVAGKPVYLGLMRNSQDSFRMKPQNLLLNLPLSAPV